MIGENIVKIRKRRGYSLSKLAELTNISKSYLSNIERNLNKNPSLQIMLKIAAVLNVDLETLLKTDKDEDTYIEKEWVDFVKELKELGVEKKEIKQYRTLIEFIKWQNQHSKN
ncbi:helix-turn-helix domain-containing protein [Peribacillus huizhouensis]|uniref:XRE family transcriptional regulator of biofilm formation n=1 Tax=Peribacillus huizhouensis TaxID=1501239 RepID=A0ABR6CKT2_9BACI|nr:helix-turn-helix transcriptional regulator [Peribacillus huizhouensis]MBA9025666.1 XRE family transcriptional regulator of biofilm formation [Peribacillus huizhouensis]